MPKKSDQLNLAQRQKVGGKKTQTFDRQHLCSSKLFVTCFSFILKGFPILDFLAFEQTTRSKANKLILISCRANKHHGNLREKIQAVRVNKKQRSFATFSLNISPEVSLSE